ncbi:hypothetical protein V8E54_004840 [Elaphomyces granulatus]
MWLARVFQPGSWSSGWTSPGLCFCGFFGSSGRWSCKISPSSPALPRPSRLEADVFANKAYQAFAARVTAASEAAKEPDDLQIKKVLPILYDRMRMMQADLRQLHAALQQSVSDLQREVRVLSTNVKTALRDSSSSRRSLRRRRSRRQRPSSPPPGPSSQSVAARPPGDESDAPSLDADADASGAPLDPASEPI